MEKKKKRKYRIDYDKREYMKLSCRRGSIKELRLALSQWKKSFPNEEVTQISRNLSFEIMQELTDRVVAVRDGIDSLESWVEGYNSSINSQLGE